jgi:hypothetical protein
MPQTRLDVLALGNAIVDVLVRTDERFLLDNAMSKGGMRLIDESEAERLSASLGQATIVSGGSAANTAVGAPLSAPRPPSSARSATTSSGGCSPPISRGSAWASTSPRQARGLRPRAASSSSRPMASAP